MKADAEAEQREKERQKRLRIDESEKQQYENIGQETADSNWTATQGSTATVTKQPSGNSRTAMQGSAATVTKQPASAKEKWIAFMLLVLSCLNVYQLFSAGDLLSYDIPFTSFNEISIIIEIIAGIVIFCLGGAWESDFSSDFLWDHLYLIAIPGMSVITPLIMLINRLARLGKVGRFFFRIPGIILTWIG